MGRGVWLALSIGLFLIGAGVWTVAMIEAGFETYSAIEEESLKPAYRALLWSAVSAVGATFSTAGAAAYPKISERYPGVGEGAAYLSTKEAAERSRQDAERLLNIALTLLTVSGVSLVGGGALVIALAIFA